MALPSNHLSLPSIIEDQVLKCMSGEDIMCFLNYTFVFHLFDCFLFCFRVTRFENKSNKYRLLHMDALFHVYLGKMGNFLNKV